VNKSSFYTYKQNQVSLKMATWIMYNARLEPKQIYVIFIMDATRNNSHYVVAKLGKDINI
jgi:hypothetical protein